MEINHEACEITFDLDTPIEVHKDKEGQVTETKVLFKKPNRKTGPIFQNLASMYSRAMMSQMAMLKNAASPEEIETATAEAKAKEEEQQKADALTTIRNVKAEDIEKEVEGMLVMTSGTDFDFEKASRLFDKIIYTTNQKFITCEIGGTALKDGVLDRIDYQDYNKMMMVYIAFFGKPVKAGTTSESETQPESATQVTEA